MESSRVQSAWRPLCIGETTLIIQRQGCQLLLQKNSGLHLDAFLAFVCQYTPCPRELTEPLWSSHLKTRARCIGQIHKQARSVYSNVQVTGKSDEMLGGRKVKLRMACLPACPTIVGKRVALLNSASVCERESNTGRQVQKRSDMPARKNRELWR